MSIFIFSRPIHSGKTTELLQWCNQQKSVSGILMPDINNKRKILDLNTKELFDIECIDIATPKEQICSVGRFHFYTAVFEKANSIIINALNKKPNWLIIDEAGKLELEGKGFYNALIKATDFYTSNKTGGNLLITVRESLCDKVIAFFKLKDCRIIHDLEEII